MSGWVWLYLLACFVTGAMVAVYVERESRDAPLAGVFGVAAAVLMPLVAIVGTFALLARKVNHR